MRRRTVGRDTTLCMSLSGRPGTFGSRFHNSLYEALGLDWIYKAFTTNDLSAAIAGIRALGVRGCAVSMPFKEACIAYLDGLAPSADAIQSVNTIVNDDGKLTGHNTDYAAVGTLLRRHRIEKATSFALHGSGGMARAVASALRDSGLEDGLIVARNPTTGQALARDCNYRYAPELGNERPRMLINVTPIGMAGGPEVDVLAFDREAIAAAEVAFDVVAVPVETPFVKAAREGGKHVITGAEVIVLQALGQFLLYTGLEPSAEQVEDAANYALGVTRAVT